MDTLNEMDLSPSAACPLGGRRWLMAIGLALCASGALAQSASGPSGSAMGHASMQMREQMMSGMRAMQSMQPTGDTDKDFAMMMRAHHQQAVDMAKVQVEHGKSPELKAMARKMMADQQKEIAQFDAWLGKHK